MNAHCVKMMSLRRIGYCRGLHVFLALTVHYRLLLLLLLQSYRNLVKLVKKSRALKLHLRAAGCQHSVDIWDHTVGLPTTRHKRTHSALINPCHRMVLDLLTPDGEKAELPVKYRDGLPTHRRSPIQVLTQQWTAGSQTCDLYVITSPTH